MVYIEISKMAPRCFQDGFRDGSKMAPRPSGTEALFLKNKKKTLVFHSQLESDPDFYLDENAARALKCVRGRKNERRYPCFSLSSPLDRQDPLSASTVWGISLADDPRQQKMTTKNIIFDTLVFFGICWYLLIIF